MESLRLFFIPLQGLFHPGLILFAPKSCDGNRTGDQTFINIICGYPSMKVTFYITHSPFILLNRSK